MSLLVDGDEVDVEGRRVEIGSVEARRGDEEVVVMRSRCEGGSGRRRWIWSRRELMVVVDGRGRESVRGRESPGKEVRRILIVWWVVESMTAVSRCGTSAEVVLSSRSAGDDEKPRESWLVGRQRR